VNPRIVSRLLLPLALLFAPHALRAQTPGVSPNPQTGLSQGLLVQGAKPLDVPSEWKQLVGIYGNGKDLKIILENEGQLFWRSAGGSSDWHASWAENKSLLVSQGKGAGNLLFYAEQLPNGSVVKLSSGKLMFSRIDAGSDPSRFFHITPVRPLDQLRAEALAAKPPQEQRNFREADLVELTTLDNSIHLDIRYARTNNFLSTPVYTQARAFMQRPAAEALVRVSRKLQPLGYGLLIHDAYRPWYVTKIFWDATPPKDHQFVANPREGSKHNRGCAVDLTLYDLATGKPVEMPGLYDEMSPRSYPNFPGGTSLQRWHRDLLRRAMESEGFAVNESEWWHFDYKDWKSYGLLNVPFEHLGKPEATAAH